MATEKTKLGQRTPSEFFEDFFKLNKSWLYIGDEPTTLARTCAAASRDLHAEGWTENIQRLYITVNQVVPAEEIVHWPDDQNYNYDTRMRIFAAIRQMPTICPEPTHPMTMSD